MLQPCNLPSLDQRILQAIARASAAPIALLKPGLWQCIWATPTYANLHGFDADALQSQELRIAMPPSQWCIWQRPLDSLRFTASDTSVTVALPFAGTQTLPTQLIPLRAGNELTGVLIQPLVDLPEQQALQLVQQSDARMRRFAAVTSEAILFYDLRGMIQDANEAAVRLSGYPLQQLCRMSLWDLAAPNQRDEVLRRLNDRNEKPFITQLKKRDGQILDVEATGRRMPNILGDYGIVVLHDVTAHQRAQARVRFLSQHDALTRLPNRHGLQAALEEALARARQANHPMTVIMVDLDRFKDVNDSLGNAAGDLVLREVARRLRSKLHPDDLLARVGSDEFAAVLATPQTGNQAEWICNEILHALSKPFAVADAEVRTPASIGTSKFPVDGQTVEALLQNAHAAMQHAKECGHNQVQHYSRQLAERPTRLLALEQQLRAAVERDELLLHYQPQIDLERNQLAGFEALVRWRHPQRGLLGPVEFIPFAESRGLAPLIGRWVIRQACRQIKVWEKAGIDLVPIAVNLSAHEFAQPNLVKQIQTILRDEGVEARWIEIEMTEGALMQETRPVYETLQSLKALGFQLAIDDFGTGYSSLAYLKRYPLDKLKIDRSFVRDTPYSSDDVSLITAIIQMGNSLQLLTVAEGVETEAQMQMLARLGCHLAQGFHIARPMPAEEAAHWRPQVCHADIAQ